MAKKYELVVFDWDGTLLDSAATIAACIQAAARDLGVPEPTEDEARHVIGLGLADALARAMPTLEPSRYAEASERYRYHFLSKDQDLNLFSGAAELVKKLHAMGLMLAVATGKSRLGLSRALMHSGLKPYFHATRCADETHSKPHPAMLQEIMDELGADPERTLMVGDTTHDLLMAVNAGVDGVGVTYGAHPKEVLLEHGPVACFDHFADLDKWLLASVKREE